MRRLFGDVIRSAGGVLLVLLALVALDDRVRSQASALVSGARPTTELVGAGVQARDVMVTVLQAARDQSLEHAPLMIFALAGTVLVLFMLRA